MNLTTNRGRHALRAQPPSRSCEYPPPSCPSKATEMKVQCLLEEKTRLALTKAVPIKKTSLETAARRAIIQASLKRREMFFESLKKTEPSSTLDIVEYYTRILNCLSETTGLSVSSIENIALTLFGLIILGKYTLNL